MFKYYFECINSYFAEVNRFLAEFSLIYFSCIFSRFALMALVPDSRVSFQKKLRMLRTNREIVIKALRLDLGKGLNMFPQKNKNKCFDEILGFSELIVTYTHTKDKRTLHLLR